MPTTIQTSAAYQRPRHSSRAERRSPATAPLWRHRLANRPSGHPHPGVLILSEPPRHHDTLNGRATACGAVHGLAANSIAISSAVTLPHRTARSGARVPAATSMDRRVLHYVRVDARGAYIVAQRDRAPTCAGGLEETSRTRRRAGRQSPVLGFDSYLFSLISGGNTDPICLRVWSQGEAASGMLGVGGLAVVTGISWLLAGHLNDEEHHRAKGPENEERAEIVTNLDHLSRFAVHGVMVAIALLLTATALDYLRLTALRHMSAWTEWFSAASPLIIASAALAAVRRRSSFGRSVSSTRYLDSAPKYASFGVLSYAIVGPIFAGIVTHLPDSWWHSLQGAIVSLALLIGLVIPIALLVLLIQAVPPLWSAESTRQSQKMDRDQ